MAIPSTEATSHEDASVSPEPSSSQSEAQPALISNEELTEELLVPVQLCAHLCVYTCGISTSQISTNEGLIWELSTMISEHIWISVDRSTVSRVIR